MHVYKDKDKVDTRWSRDEESVSYAYKQRLICVYRTPSLNKGRKKMLSSLINTRSSTGCKTSSFASILLYAFPLLSAFVLSPVICFYIVVCLAFIIQLLWRQIPPHNELSFTFMILMFTLWWQERRQQYYISSTKRLLALKSLSNLLSSLTLVTLSPILLQIIFAFITTMFSLTTSLGITTVYILYKNNL